jgi:hypothetical protein
LSEGKNYAHGLGLLILHELIRVHVFFSEK